ncbi:MAG TPA: hypothetical protein VF014_16320 [Casimicrobiaceae bacterium]|nr:hypothetical protein [Casimicrobiaceae bacterium]
MPRSEPDPDGQRRSFGPAPKVETRDPLPGSEAPEHVSVVLAFCLLELLLFGQLAPGCTALQEQQQGEECADGEQERDEHQWPVK